MTDNEKSEMKSQSEIEIEKYQDRMTWVVAAEDLEEEEFLLALRKKLNIRDDMEINDKNIIQNARKVQNWMENSGNVAYVKFKYNFPENITQKGYIMAIDGKQFVPGTALIESKDGKKSILIDPIAPVSQIFKVKNVAEEGEWYHAVRKLIITMADLWELNKLLNGEVIIASEGSICKSCRKIISKLESEYQNIKISSIREKVL